MTMKPAMNNSLLFAGNIRVIVVGLSLTWTLSVSMNCYGQAGGNIAPLATLSGPGTQLHAVVDGVKQQDYAREWIGGSPNLWFGWIHYPKNLELKWEPPQRINKLVIYDRTKLEEHMAACILTFSDGSRVDVCAVPNNGSAKTSVFEPLTVTGMRLDVIDGIGEIGKFLNVF